MIKLSIEMVPETCWNSNLRSILKKSEWDKIRREVYHRASNECEICGNVGRIEAHEIWNYDDEAKTQTLTGLIALCSPCHLVKHMGFARISGKEVIAVEQLMLINNWSREEAEKYIEEIFKIWEERSLHQWTQDITFLSTFQVTKLEKRQLDSNI